MSCEDILTSSGGAYVGECRVFFESDCVFFKYCVRQWNGVRWRLLGAYAFRFLAIRAARSINSRPYTIYESWSQK